VEAFKRLNLDSDIMPEFPTVYTISPSTESTVAVEVLLTGLLGRKKKHTLSFENFNGQIRFAANDPAASHLLLTVDARSLVCRDAGFTEKQRRTIAEFAREQALEAERYPEIRYTSTCIRAKPLRGFVVAGILQIRGTTREVRINMAWSPKRNNQFQLDGDGAVRLSDFDLPRPSQKCGLIKTADEAMIHLLLWAVASDYAEAGAAR